MTDGMRTTVKKPVGKSGRIVIHESPAMYRVTIKEHAEYGEVWPVDAKKESFHVQVKVPGDWLPLFETSGLPLVPAIAKAVRYIQGEHA